MDIENNIKQTENKLKSSKKLTFKKFYSYISLKSFNKNN